ncbi:hypothetical protein ACWCPB_16100, partial [Streptomyces sp. NPDC001811]
PGFTNPQKFVDGNPYGTSHADGQGTKPVGETTRLAAAIQAERVVEMAARLKAAAEAQTGIQVEVQAETEAESGADTGTDAGTGTEEGPRRWWQRRRR